MKPRSYAVLGMLVPTLALVLTASGCKPRKMSGGHDHGASQSSSGGHNHGAGDRPKFSHLRFTDSIETFINYPVFQAGENSTVAVHLTRLQNYQPINEGKIEVLLTGPGGEQRFNALRSSVPGQFTTDIKPTAPGKANLTVIWDSPEKTVKINLGEHEIYKTLENAVHADVEGEPEGIYFPKDQQALNEFAVAQTTNKNLFNVFEAYACVQAAPGMEGRLLAPASGRLEGNTFPSVGQRVHKGQKIGNLVPKGGPELSMGSLQLELKKAELRHRLASKEVKRMKALLEFGAVPQKQAEEADHELALSETELQVAKANLTNAQTGRGGLPLPLIAPASGIVSSAGVNAGIHVTENQELIYIVDPKRLRLEVQVPEAQAASLSSIQSIWFQTPGLTPVTLEARKHSRIRLLGSGGVVNPEKRTVPFVMEFDNPGGEYKVGHAGKALVRWGKPSNSLAVPANSLQDEDGMNVVYTQVGGDTFERKIVKVGARDGEWVQITSGLENEDRVVVKGAHLVRLAASKSKLPSQGCIH